MKIKKTIVAGCSWADRNYKSRHLPNLDTSWKKWDEYLSESYDWDVINVAKMGSSNDYIINEAIKQIHNNNVERCVVALSDWGRCTLPSGYTINPMTSLVQPKDKPKNPQAVKFFETYSFNHHMHKQIVKDTLFKLYCLIDLCEMKNIEVIVIQMIDSIENFQLFCSNKEYVNLNNMMLDDPYFEKIEESNAKIMGWPFVKDIGGFNIKHLLEKGEDWAISKDDRHPNAEGHKEIANIIMKWYDK